MRTNRRFFLKSLGIGAGSLMLTPWAQHKLEAAPKAKDRNFIFCYFSGGWDTLMCLDPRDPGKFSESKINETGIQLGWDRLSSEFSKVPLQPSGSNIAFGPAIGNFQKHYDKTCLVRGISMDTVTHQVGKRYFLTGMPPAGLNAVGSSLATRIVANQGDNTPIPNLVVKVETYSNNRPSFAGGLKVSSITDLLSTLKDGPNAPEKEVRALLEAYRKERVNCDPVSLNADGLLDLIKTAQTKSRFLVDSDLGRYFNFTNRTDPEMVKIASRYNVTNLSSPEAQAAMAFQSIKNKIAQSVTIELASDLDSHSEEWATDHPKILKRGFNALSALVDDLSTTKSHQGGNLLDHTTIVVFSEFGRGPKINNRDGRDHSLVNSCLLIGAGVPHNKVIGATSTGMNPLAIDPNTGKATKAGGIVLSPRLIYASLMESLEYDHEVYKYRVNALPCLISKS